MACKLWSPSLEHQSMYARHELQGDGLVPSDGGKLSLVNSRPSRSPTLDVLGSASQQVDVERTPGSRTIRAGHGIGTRSERVFRGRRAPVSREPSQPQAPCEECGV